MLSLLTYCSQTEEIFLDVHQRNGKPRTLTLTIGGLRSVHTPGPLTLHILCLFVCISCRGQLTQLPKMSKQLLRAHILQCSTSNDPSYNYSYSLLSSHLCFSTLSTILLSLLKSPTYLLLAWMVGSNSLLFLQFRKESLVANVNPLVDYLDV